MIPATSNPLRIHSDTTRCLSTFEPESVCLDYKNTSCLDVRFAQILHSPTLMLTRFIPASTPSANNAHQRQITLLP